MRMRAIKENSILSFNTAANFPVDFIEFDVQVGINFSFLYFCSFFLIYNLISKKKKKQKQKQNLRRGLSSF